MSYKTRQSYTIPQLFKLLPPDFYDDIADHTNVDNQVKRLHGELFLKLLLYGVLKNGRLSTRMLEAYYNSGSFQKLTAKGGHRTRHSSIASRLNTVNPDFFTACFEKLQTMARRMKTSKSAYDKILRIDSTMVSSAAKILHEEGMQVGQRPQYHALLSQIKYTIGMQGDFPTKGVVYLNKKYLSENHAIGEFVRGLKIERDTVLVFDRGVASRDLYDWMTDNEFNFVTRLKEKSVYKELETISNTKGSENDKLVFERDILVALKTGRHVLTKHNYRIVIAKEKAGGKKILFLTNNIGMDAPQVAEIYRKRWDIEKFFRFVKQELSMKTIINTSENGIKVMLLVRLMASILILIFKQKNKIEGYKIARIKFEEGLYAEIIKSIVKACNGDPKLVDNLYLAEDQVLW